MNKVQELEALGFTRREILEAMLGAPASAVEHKGSGTPTDADLAPVIGKICIVRGYGSGVHCGVVVSAVTSSNGRLRVTLAPGNVRLWSWFAAGGNRTLSGVASYGVDASKTKAEAQATAKVIPDCCELNECAEGVGAAILAQKWGA